MTEKTLKIAIVGPTHPYKGGIPLHTTELAHQLKRAGHQVQLVSWRAQYPKFLYPGEMYVPGDKPETEPFQNTTRRLRWYDPLGWLRAGRKLRGCDMVIFVFAVPQFNATSGLAMLRGMGRRRPRTIALCHNVLPHEPRPGDKQLARAFLSRVDKVITHTAAQADIAKNLTSKPVVVADIPPTQLAMPGAAHPSKLFHHLLFLGVVRPYKGVDVLLRALAEVPDVKLTIAGELWGNAEAELKTLIAELDLKKRVKIIPGYVPIEQFNELFAAADASVLPYRSSTATQNVSLAHNYGVPAIATRVGSMAGQVRDGIDGLLCQPGDPHALAQAIQHFYEPGVAAKLRAGIKPPNAAAGWQRYIAALIG